MITARPENVKLACQLEVKRRCWRRSTKSMYGSTSDVEVAQEHCIDVATKPVQSAVLSAHEHSSISFPFHASKQVSTM